MIMKKLLFTLMFILTAALAVQADIAINSTNFPDPYFRSKLQYLFGTSLSQTEINNCTSLDLSSWEGHGDDDAMSNLQGIQYFTALTDLDVSWHNITNIDMTGNTNLVNLYACCGELRSINVTGLTKLKILDLSENGYLTTITGLTTCTALQDLDCGWTNITSLNVKGLKSLSHINVEITCLKALDITGCTSLSGLSSVEYLGYNTGLDTLKCASTNFTSLNVSSWPNLRYLDCSYNSLTSLNVSSNTALKNLRCQYNRNLSTLSGLSYCTALENLLCYECNLSTISGLPSLHNLKYLNCDNNSLTSLSVSGKSKLTTLYCGDNSITSLNVTGCTALTTLDCSSNSNLSSVTGLANCTALKVLKCEYCSFTDLSVVNNFTDLEILWCWSNKLNSLNVSNKSHLQEVSCSYNPQMSTIDVSSNPSMTKLSCSNCTTLTHITCSFNALTTLIVTGNTALKYLYCQQNHDLAAITGLAGCTALQQLYCNSCALTDLSAVNSLSNLTSLICHHNQLPSLTVTSKSALRTLDCADNPQLTTINAYDNPALTSLDCRNCTGLTKLYCYNNALTTLNVTGNTALNYLSCRDNTSLATITGLNGCTAMETFYCYNCALTNLSAVSGMSNLKLLSCFNNQLGSLTVNNKNNLQTLACYNNPQMTTLAVSSNPSLTKLTCNNCTSLATVTCSNNNVLTTLNVTGNTALNTLDCHNCSNLTSITGLNGCTAMNSLLCYYCALTDLSAANSLNNLTRLVADHNQLTSLTVTNKSQLAYINCGYNSLSSLDVTGNSAMTNLNCNGNTSLAAITGLNGCTAIKTLYCADCALTSLDVLYLNDLEQFNCSYNQLSSLYVANKSNLTKLWCYNNPPMTSLTVTHNDALTMLECSSNASLSTVKAVQNIKLTSLTVSGNTAMTELDCNFCVDLPAITGLESCRALKKLNCSYCSITDLSSVRNLSNLETLNCGFNLLTSLSVQGCTPLTSLHCEHNLISGAGMTTLVNSLPMRSQANQGNLFVIDEYTTFHNAGEGNTMTADQVAAAKARYWIPKYADDFGFWHPYEASTPGDVNGDGALGIADVTDLIDLLLSGATTGQYPVADVNGDGQITIADVTDLIDMLLGNN